MDLPVRSISETSRDWQRRFPERGCSYACVRKWALQGRIETVKDASGRRILGVLASAEPPPKATPGTLTQAQRAVWGRG